MTAVTAAIIHHSVASARVIAINGNIARAKRAATREFGDGFLDHIIVIRDQYGEPVASRRIGDRRWQ